jgi:hypothetical protein
MPSLPISSGELGSRLTPVDQAQDLKCFEHVRPIQRQTSANRVDDQWSAVGVEGEHASYDLTRRQRRHLGVAMQTYTGSRHRTGAGFTLSGQTQNIMRRGP